MERLSTRCCIVGGGPAGMMLGLRELPTRVIQRLQILIQNHVIAIVLAGRGTLRPPLPLRVIGRLPWFRRLAARLVGIGIRPEHIRTPARRA